jgi:hypothetical protein
MSHQDFGDKEKKMSTFMKQILDDLDYEGEDNSPNRILAACQDTQSDLYLLVMAVPRSAIVDGDGPDIWRTPDKNRFLVCINEEVLTEKVEYINLMEPDASEDKKNEMMGEFISGFLPAMFEKAASMEPLDI